MPQAGVSNGVVVRENITDAVDIDALTEPVDFFLLYVDDKLLDLMVKETNNYAEQVCRDKPNSGPFSFAACWTPTDKCEMKQFIGLTFLTGLIKKKELRDYWSTNSILETPIFPAVMKRNRYQSLLKFVHWNNNDHAPDPTDCNRDRLYKIRTLVDHLQMKFAEFFTPSANICIDKCLLLFKGRLV